jgi:hypothetical protein
MINILGKNLQQTINNNLGKTSNEQQFGKTQNSKLIINNK